MEMQVSLSHNHAHHGSMCTDKRTRVGGEEATARRSRKKARWYNGWRKDDKVTRRGQTILKHSLPGSCQYSTQGGQSNTQDGQ